MDHATAATAINRRLIDQLYTEAMVLADDARSYFDGPATVAREALDLMARMSFSCEALKSTTRLMHVIAWLLAQRAIDRGELNESARLDPRYQLGEAAPADSVALLGLPIEARLLIRASEDLYTRVARLDRLWTEPPADPVAQGASPARDLMDRLERAF
jgi:regulator of CtrA degradation